MNVIIVGCGRVGVELAHTLHKEHVVTVIDKNARAFDQLGLDFLGRTVQGEALDRKALQRAGVETAGALAAVTSSDNVNAIVARIAPGLRDVPVNLETSGNTDHEGLAVRHLFVDGRTPGTVLLWMTFFMNLLILYFILSWLPALLRQAGMAVSAGITAVLIFSVGGVVGTILQGPLLRLLGAYVGVMTQSTMTVLLVALGSTIFATFPLMMVVTFVLGVCVQGLQATLNALAAMYYPTVARSTGVGWALGVGRIGSIVGPLIGGVMLSLQWTPQQIFLAGTIPAFVAVGAILVSGQLQGDASPYRPPAESSGAAVPSQRS